MGITRTKWWVGERVPVVFSILTLGAFVIFLNVKPISAGTQSLKFNRSQFFDLTDPCSRTGEYNAVINRSHPAALLKLDTRYKTLVTYQTFDCVIKIKTEFGNKSRDYYNDNEDIALLMFDINHGYRRKEDAIKLELVHIAKLDKNGTRFFYQKKKFQLPQYVPQSLPGYVMYGFEEIAQWHAESNSSISVKLKRWKSSGSIYFVFAQYRIVSPYHCDTGIEVDCNENTAVFAHCFPHTLLPLFLDGLPFCDFRPLHAIHSNRTTCSAPNLSLPSYDTLLVMGILAQIWTAITMNLSTE
eukprot:TRINITY_DN20461_c0_g1_i1.p1 TRINITY_DN20461_c0_g1~~TRINITY_DN20461_c0_g1_i1.p1  ORF type:complete len:299 (-),score=42.69 TRINITY_DN20461_c0_g1_i1:182-1078(-)